MLRQIFKHSVLYTVASQVPTIVNLFLLPVISPFLSTEDYAIYGLLLAYVGATGAFSSLGFLVLFQNAFFRDKENFRSTWAQYLGFQHWYKLLYGAIVATMIYFVFADDVGDRIWTVIFLVCAPLVFFDFTKVLGMRFCQYRQQHQLVYRSTVVTGMVTAAITFYSIFYLHLGFMGWLIASFVGAMLQFIYFGHLLYIREKLVPVWKFNWKFIMNGLRISAPTIPHAYSTYLLNTSDRLVLDWNNISKFDLGQYNLAYGFASYFDNFNSQVNAVVSPVYFELFSKNDLRANKLVRNITYLWFSAVLIAACLVGLWSREIFEFLYRNEELKTAYPYAIFILISFAYRPLYVASVDRAIFHEKTLSLLKISTVAGLMNLTLNLIFVPFFGAWAAAVNTLISFGYMGVAGHYMRTTKKFLGVRYHVEVALILMGMCSVGIFLLSEMSLWVKSGVTAFIFLCCWVLYIRHGKYMINEINSIRKK